MADAEITKWTGLLRNIRTEIINLSKKETHNQKKQQDLEAEHSQQRAEISQQRAEISLLNEDEKLIKRILGTKDMKKGGPISEHIIFEERTWEPRMSQYIGEITEHSELFKKFIKKEEGVMVMAVAPAPPAMTETGAMAGKKASSESGEDDLTKDAKAARTAWGEGGQQSAAATVKWHRRKRAVVS